MKTELMPCPFCGGKATLKQTGKNKLTIKCGNCLAKMEQRVLKNSLQWLEEEMNKDWNKRLTMA